MVIYVKKELDLKLIFKDKEGQYVAVEITLYGKKTLLLNIYTPNGSKEKFFINLLKRLQDEAYEDLILVGDFNGVVDPKWDKQS